MEAVQVLIEEGAVIEAADEVRIHSQATTHALNTHTHAHTGLRERTI